MNARCRHLIAFGFVVAAALGAHAETATSGDIAGRVFNASTGAALRNARVSVDSGRREVVTDDFGTYRLSGVAVGEAQINVSYVGLETQRATVIVTAGAITQRDFDLTLGVAGRTATAGVVQLNAVTVVADREMSAQAVAQNERKNAANIRQIVAFDEFGDRGAEDIGELMRFLPGVGVVDGGQTASTIALRGLPDNNTSLQLDGADLASARGNSRTQSLLDVPMANISRVEINKVPVPDQPSRVSSDFAVFSALFSRLNSGGLKSSQT